MSGWIKPLIVRCALTRMTFEVDRDTLEAKHTSRYDAYCFTDPDPEVEYISFGEWHMKLYDMQRKEGMI